VDVGVGGAGEDRQGGSGRDQHRRVRGAARRPATEAWSLVGSDRVSRRSAQMELSARQSQADSSARRWYG